MAVRTNWGARRVAPPPPGVYNDFRAFSCERVIEECYSSEPVSRVKVVKNCSGHVQRALRGTARCHAAFTAVWI